MKVQIIGAVSKLTRSHVVRKFAIAEEELKAAGHEVWNPVTEVPENTSYADAMRMCIRHLCEVDAVAVQRDWYISEGAKTEYMIANSLKLKFIHLFKV